MTPLVSWCESGQELSCLKNPSKKRHCSHCLSKECNMTSFYYWSVFYNLREDSDVFHPIFSSLDPAALQTLSIIHILSRRVTSAELSVLSTDRRAEVSRDKSFSLWFRCEEKGRLHLLLSSDGAKFLPKKYGLMLFVDEIVIRRVPCSKRCSMFLSTSLSILCRK